MSYMCTHKKPAANNYPSLTHFSLKYSFRWKKPTTSMKIHSKVLLSLAAGMEVAEKLWQIHHTWSGGHLSWGKWYYSCSKFRQIVLKWAAGESNIRAAEKQKQK